MSENYRQDIRYGMGLDIGITSVGWAVVGLDDRDEPCGIIDMGSRIFEAAEHPKDGSSLAAPRRMARSTRRRTRRRAHRKERIRHLIVEEGLLSQKQIETLFQQPDLDDIYLLRTRGLDMPLRPEDFARILINLAQRRGFKSNRKADAADKESGKLLQAVEANQARMQEGGWRSVGEMFARDPFYQGHKRNKDGVYLSTVQRDMVEEEAHLLFSRQRALGQAFATEKLESKYINILLSQRSFDEGPGGNSPYGGNQVERMRGTCLFTGDRRAPKAAWSFERFRFWQSVNNLRIQSKAYSRELTDVEKKLIFEEATRKDVLKYQHIRKLVDMTNDERFAGLNYDKKRTEEKSADTESGGLDVKKAEDKTFVQLRAYHILRRAFDTVSKNRILEFSDDALDGIAEVLSCYKQQESILEGLRQLGLEERDRLALAQVPSFRGFGHISCKACQKLLPFLMEGMSYDKACEAAGFDFKGHERKPQLYLPANQDEMQDVTSPVVRRAIAQTIKVTNGIIRLMGHSPVFVKIELAREMAKDFAERREMMKSMEENAVRNERLMKRLKEEFHVMQPTGLDLVKLKLLEEQNGRCAYSIEAFDTSRLFEKGYAEIDHIIPYSISFDDSYNNKVLVKAKENQEKRNHLPLEYLSGERKERFIVYTQNAPYRGNKKRHLLKQAITQEDERQFKERNLQDTKHMSRFLFNYINDYLQFDDFVTSRKKHVTAVNGNITSHLRKRWGLSKFRENGDTHHAQDAVVIACATDGMIAQISRFYAKEEADYQLNEAGTHSIHSSTGEIFPLPWPGFRDDMQLRIEAQIPSKRLEDLRLRGCLPSYDILPDAVISSARPLFVSRMPDRKISGAAHKDTVKGIAGDGSNLVIKRVSIDTLKLKDEEIADYYRPDDDPALYSVLRERLINAGGDAKKAFADPIYKPGSKAPVRKVKICEKSTLNVAVHGGKGVADNGSMVRIDIFYVINDGYYLVPIYVADTVKEVLPSKACVAGKVYEQWTEMREEDFLFSLYTNDLISIEDRSPVKLTLRDAASKLPLSREARQGELVYYRKCNISSAKIEGCSHDNAYLFGKGLKTLRKIEKYQVDVLGNVSKVNKERRMPFR